MGGGAPLEVGGELSGSFGLWAVQKAWKGFVPGQNLLKLKPKDYYRHPPPHPGGKATHGVWDSIITTSSLHSGLPLSQGKVSPN